jgi:hypothetical protein
MRPLFETKQHDTVITCTVDVPVNFEETPINLEQKGVSKLVFPEGGSDDNGPQTERTDSRNNKRATEFGQEMIVINSDRTEKFTS